MGYWDVGDLLISYLSYRAIVRDSQRYPVRLGTLTVYICVLGLHGQCSGRQK